MASAGAVPEVLQAVSHQHGVAGTSRVEWVAGASGGVTCPWSQCPLWPSWGLPSTEVQVSPLTKRPSFLLLPTHIALHVWGTPWHIWCNHGEGGGILRVAELFVWDGLSLSSKGKRHVTTPWCLCRCYWCIPRNPLLTRGSEDGFSNSVMLPSFTFSS